MKKKTLCILSERLLFCKEIRNIEKWQTLRDSRNSLTTWARICVSRICVFKHWLKDRSKESLSELFAGIQYSHVWRRVQNDNYLLQIFSDGWWSVNLKIIRRLKTVLERWKCLFTHGTLQLDLAPINQTLVAENVAAIRARFVHMGSQTDRACFFVVNSFSWIITRKFFSRISNETLQIKLNNFRKKFRDGASKKHFLVLNFSLQ